MFKICNVSRVISKLRQDVDRCINSYRAVSLDGNIIVSPSKEGHSISEPGKEGNTSWSRVVAKGPVMTRDTGGRDPRAPLKLTTVLRLGVLAGTIPHNPFFFDG